MDISRQLDAIRRGAAEIIPEEDLKKKLEASARTGQPLRIKYGIDPTIPDVHLGHLVPVRKMRIFEDLGHTGVLIIGDYTAQIGDPTGLDAAREGLTYERVRANAAKYVDQLFTVLDPKRTEVHFQTEWFGPMHLQDVVHLLAKFTFAQMMAHDTFRSRVEKGLPLSLHEIVYPVLQAYDSVAIRADVELGATEQKFNILLGRDLQRVHGHEPQVAVLSPMLMGIDGVAKMSKSLGNFIAVWDPPREKFGKVMSIPDSLIDNYYEYITDVGPDELRAIRARLADSATNPRDLKVELARRVVAIFHSDKEASAAAAEFERVFKERQVPDEMPEVRIEPSQCRDGTIWIVRLLKLADLASSGGDARRLVSQGAVMLDDETISDPEAHVRLRDGAVLRVGKRRFARVRLGGD